MSDSVSGAAPPTGTALTVSSEVCAPPLGGSGEKLASDEFPPVTETVVPLPSPPMKVGWKFVSIGLPSSSPTSRIGIFPASQVAAARSASEILWWLTAFWPIPLCPESAGVRWSAHMGHVKLALAPSELLAR